MCRIFSPPWLQSVAFHVNKEHAQVVPQFRRPL